TNTNDIKLIQAKNSINSTLDTAKLDSTTDWQSLRFRVDGDQLKVRSWQGDEEPDQWDINTVAGNVMPFAERVQSGKSVGVPGTRKGLEKELDKWGRKARQELIQHATDSKKQG